MGELTMDLPVDAAVLTGLLSFKVHCANFLHNPSRLEDLPDAAVVDSPGVKS